MKADKQSVGTLEDELAVMEVHLRDTLQAPREIFA
jgi:hypothetical protein